MKCAYGKWLQERVDVMAGAAILLSLTTCALNWPSSKHLSPTVGEVCKHKTVSGDITYYEDDKVCAQTYPVERHDDMGGWTYAHIIGSDQQAVFKNELDAEVWLRAQPYVRPAWQVR